MGCVEARKTGRYSSERGPATSPSPRGCAAMVNAMTRYRARLTWTAWAHIPKALYLEAIALLGAFPVPSGTPPIPHPHRPLYTVVARHGAGRRALELARHCELPLRGERRCGVRACRQRLPALQAALQDGPRRQARAPAGPGGAPWRTSAPRGGMPRARAGGSMHHAAAQPAHVLRMRVALGPHGVGRRRAGRGMYAPPSASVFPVLFASGLASRCASPPSARARLAGEHSLRRANLLGTC